MITFIACLATYIQPTTWAQKNVQKLEICTTKTSKHTKHPLRTFASYLVNLSLHYQTKKILKISILNKYLNEQIKMGCQFVSKLKVHEKMVEKHHSSFTYPKTMTMEVSINLKYLDNHCFKITLEDKLITHFCHMIACQTKICNLFIICIHN